MDDSETAGLDYDIDSGATYLNCTRRQVERFWREGKLSGARLGNKVQFTKQDLDDFVARSRKAVSA